MTGSNARKWMAALAAALTTAVAGNASAQSVFLESNGYVAIEAESADIVDGWVEHDPEVGNARGKAMRFTAGQSICNSPANAAEDYPTLDYHIRITTAGTYRLKMNIFKQIHCVTEGNDGNSCHSGAGCQSFGIQSDGDSCNDSNRCWRSDISNDAFVNITTADGTGIPYVGGGTQIMKFFGGSGNSYAWSGNSSLDHNAPDYDLVPGDYIIKVRGRSRGFSFDRLVFYTDNENDAKDSAESPVAMDDPVGTGGAAGTGGDAGTGGAVGTGGDTGTGGDAVATGGATGTGAAAGTGAAPAGTGAAPVVDPGTGGATDPGVDPGASGGGDMEGDPPTGEDAEPSDDSGSSSDTGGCSVGGSGGSSPTIWLMLAGLLFWASRRRRTV